jgi:hypothetical protein
VSAQHAAEVEARAARRAAEQAAQREAARAASRRAKEAAERVAEAVRLAEAARELGNGEGADERGEGVGQGAGGGTGSGGVRDADGAGGARTPRKRDVWAAATADAGVAAVGGEETLDHDGSGATKPDERGGAAGDDARGDDAV